MTRTGERREDGPGGSGTGRVSDGSSAGPTGGAAMIGRHPARQARASRKGHQTVALFPGRRSIRRLMEVLLGTSFSDSGSLGYADAGGGSHRRSLRGLGVFQRRRGGAAFGLGVGCAHGGIQSWASLVTSQDQQTLRSLRQDPARFGLKKRMGPQELGQ